MVMDWEVCGIIRDLEHARETLRKLDNLDYKARTIAKYLNGYELDRISDNVSIALYCISRIIEIIRGGYERKVEDGGKDDR